MSWLARSIANSLHLDDVHDDAVLRSDENEAIQSECQPRETDSISGDDGLLCGSGDEDLNQGRGVKEDLSELKDSITRQFWGVASFLAPPPPPPLPPPLPGKRGAVNSKLESDWTGPDDRGEESGELEDSLPLEACNAGGEEEAVGITEEVLAFGMNIAHHPETWLDFPLSEEEEFDDFDISDAQYKHAFAVEQLAPRLAALKNELCPAHMSEGFFWMVYFVLLHSRLNKHDADLLSSPQIVEARVMWMQELQKRTKEDSYWTGIPSGYHLKKSAESSPREKHSSEDSPSSSGYMSYKITNPFEPNIHHYTTQQQTVKHTYNEVEFIDKSVIKEDPLPRFQEKSIVMQNDNDEEDDDDDWLKDDSDLVGLSSTLIMVDEEDISFSDLEDDFDCTMPVKSKRLSADWNTETF